MLCEIVVPVENMDNCRCFYRDILALGEPVVDSLKHVQFRLTDTTMLTLEKSALPGYTPHSIFLRLQLDNFPQVKTNLIAQEIALVPYDESSVNQYFRISDPAGNVLIIGSLNK